jgi:periplasmic mercuric ion binding protein
MKSVKLYMLAAASAIFAIGASAQTKTETFKVSGNCGMCKTKIEKAAKEAGAKEASWNADAKTITVTYKSSTTNAAKIQTSIAEAGYDNEGAKATEGAYNKLHACCQYEREASMSSKKASCCTGKCEMKDGKCADMAACKEKGCCKDEAACKASGCCSDKQMGHEKMDCCKGKCEMKDGKCADMAACKEKGCCKDEAACKASGCCSDKQMGHEKMDCCKEGKCSKEGHKGGDCCKKEK